MTLRPGGASKPRKRPLASEPHHSGWLGQRQSFCRPSHPAAVTPQSPFRLQQKNVYVGQAPHFQDIEQ